MGRLLLLLDTVKNKLSLPSLRPLNIIIPMSSKQHHLALLVAQNLTTASICCDLFLEKASLKALMNKAHKMGALHVLIIGEQEQQDGTVTIKNMNSGSQVTLKQTEIQTFLAQ
jgi:histidyl-tRNA synthetase